MIDLQDCSSAAGGARSSSLRAILAAVVGLVAALLYGTTLDELVHFLGPEAALAGLVVVAGAGLLLGGAAALPAAAGVLVAEYVVMGEGTLDGVAAWGLLLALTAAGASVLHGRIRGGTMRAAQLLARQQRIVATVRDVLFETDARGRWTFLNPAWERVFGIPIHEALGRHFLEFVHPAHHAECAAIFDDLVAGRRELGDHEVRYLTARGDARWMNLNIRPVPGGGTAGRLADMTERREAEDALRRLNDELEQRVEARVSELRRANDFLAAEVAHRRAAQDELRRSERHFRALIENAADVVAVFTPGTGFVYVSPSVERLLELEPDAALGMAPVDLLDDAERPAARAMLQRLLADREGTERGEFHVRTRRGARRTLEVTCRNLLDEPAVRGIVLNARDLTERNEALERLRRSERDYHGLFENATDAIIILDPATETVLDANPRAGELLGVPREALAGRAARGTWGAARDTRDLMARTLRDGTQRFESELARPGGGVLHLEVRATRVEYQGRTAVLSSLRDVTEARLHAAELQRSLSLLQASEERFRQIAESVREVFYIYDLDAGRMLYVSPGYAEVWGRPVNHILDDPYAWLESVHPEDRVRLTASMTEPGREWSAEYRILRPDGAIRWIWGRGFPVRDESGRVYREVGINEDVTDRKEAQEAMHAAELAAHREAERMRAVAHAAGGVVTARSEAELVRVLEDACRSVLPFDLFFLLGYDAATGTVAALGEPDPAYPELARKVPVEGTPAQRVMASGASLLTARADDARLDGAVLAPHGFQAAIRAPVRYGREWLGLLSVQSRTPDLYTLADLEVVEAVAALAATALVSLRLGEEQARSQKALHESQRQLLQSQKMEAVGLLAGGIAHDFNNMLMAIGGHAELLRTDPRLPGQVRWQADEIKKAADRSASLTRQLLAFSRKQVMQPRPLSVNAVVADIEGMLRRLIGEDVRLRTALTADVGVVRADPGQLEQVLLNLAVNARDAMPDGGSLTIETANVLLDEAYAGTREEIRPGRYVMLAVSDTGTGMPPEVRQRVFEPFFSTKPQGKGTGLGLSTVYGIVRQSGGHVWVYSEPGQGTTFKIYLPREDAPPEHAPVKAAPARAAGGDETILLVEDDEVVRVLLRMFLRRQGYAVLDAENGEAALEVESAHDGPIHLLLTDVVMPGMNGRMLAGRVREHRPATRVLYMSGYTDDAISQHGVLDPGSEFIEKPIGPEHLATRVRAVLDGCGRDEGHPGTSGA